MPLARFFSAPLAGRATSLRPFAYAVGGVVLFGVIFATFWAGRTATMVQNIMVEKGTALISALESSMRTSKRSGAGLRLQFLLEELASRKDVRFMALTMPDGTILAHSNPRRIGEILSTTNNREMTRDDMARLHVGDDPSATLMHLEGGHTFAVYQRFHMQPPRSETPPFGEDLFSMWNGVPLLPPPPPPSPGPSGEHSPEKARLAPPAPYVVVGLHPRSLYAAYRYDRQRVWIIGTGFIAGGLALVALAYGVARFRASRRGQRVAEALAEELALTLPDGLVLLDPKGRVVRMNEEALRLMGLVSAPVGQKAEEALPLPLAECVGKLQDRATLTDTPVVLNEGDEASQRHLTVRGGHVRDVFEGVLGTLMILRDMTEVRRLEAEVRRREKMAAVGNLAAGVAHELRNPLSSIKGYATYFAGRFAPGSEDRKAAQVMVREADRLNRAITDLIGLSRPTDIHPQTTDLGLLVEDVMRLVRQDAAQRKVVVRLEPEGAFGPDLRAGSGERFGAVVDADRIRQVVLNLCLNALDAMPDGGELCLSLSWGQADGRQVVALEVRDSGCGIPPDDLPHIFDPYFTTKGHGTGLGLATVLKIMEAHNASVTVRSTPGQGTVFRLQWPVIEAADNERSGNDKETA